MHLLAAQPGTIEDGSEAVDLGQTPGDIVFLTAADTEIACLAAAQARRLGEAPDAPALRLASLLHLSHNLSVDLHIETVASQAKLVIARLLGGRAYWPYGVEQLTESCREHGVALALLPGDDQPDAELAGLSTLPAEALHRLWQYCVHGGVDNATQLLRYAASLIGREADWAEPAPLLRAGLYWPGVARPGLEDLPWREGDFPRTSRRLLSQPPQHEEDLVYPHPEEARPVAAVVFYRALVQAGNLKAVDALIAALDRHGVDALPIYAASLKDPVSDATIRELFARARPDVILNATGFALSSPGAARAQTPFDGADCPVLQVVFSGGNEESWRAGTRGLSARDIAMNVALPEVDGRILARAVSFKGRARRDDATETDVVEYLPVPDRADFTAALAANWALLRRKTPDERRVALVLANYPNRDGRIGNGVGLDTPAGTVTALRALVAAGYRVEDIPAGGNALVAQLAQGPTNAAVSGRQVRETLPFSEYQLFFASLPKAVRDAVTERWGAAEADPFFRPGETDCGAFAIPAFRCGNAAICLQPARGYNIDPVASYHDPALAPPHNYLAFYAWLRHAFRADAVIHMGKHGNLEWLPGKALALSAECFPEAALGPLPNLYPFIVNDPGEGTQAKRRSAAVIVDHLTPPLTRAESYGPLRDLEQLVDEYYEAAGVDPRRIKLLGRQIVELAQSIGLDRDAGVAPKASEAETLAALDNYLCELKEMQIRDGLHVFGESPQGGLLTDLLVALARVPRNKGEGQDQSLIRAIARDFDLNAFDPLDCVLGEAWTGPRPAALETAENWRTQGDTVERLELFARRLVAGEANPPGDASRAVLDWINGELHPSVAACGAGEIAGLMAGLDGRFVAPGPSGAPTRGRPDVLPTGRNFYSVDTRAVPTPAAWLLGWKSAQMLVERHAQEHGSWPQAMALSAWGTSNMRTGGDDIAQALALMGVRPTWDSASRRVTGFEVLPLDILDRPRVDVTLRISGFFRDAFPWLIDLVDSAARAVAALDEPEAKNPLAARVRDEATRLAGNGLDTAAALRRAATRVFGSKPGAYGAGLQALIDERGWDSDADLARAYLAWGGYAYGAGAEGEAAHGLFEARLKSVEAVIHNQDNREHDLLDSDDYYQFEGGMTAAVRVLSGRQPAVWHNDHSRPESPRVRTLDEEVARVVRARVVNPKWIAGVMRHGYKGASEMAATVDYLFAFAATARCVADHHFDAVYDAYLGDEAVRGFIEAYNPAALREIADRLKEAQDRGLWRPKSNRSYGALSELSQAGR
ncbi:MAG: cobaltochelatase subunit CobN [Alphaproteobacteria bacterium]|nr:cobaltochelatase subunit CobN [Alphaproteobacteria bacterium]